MEGQRFPLVELHAHLYGCLPPAAVLERLMRLQAADERVWQRYESGYRAAFGQPSLARELVTRAARGDSSAARDFAALFVYGDDDGGDFAKFQAKFNLIVVGSAVGRAFFDASDAAREAAAAEVADVAKLVLETDRRQGLAWSEQRMLLGPLAPAALVERVLEAVLGTYHEQHARFPSATVPRLAWSLPREDPWTQWPLVRQAALGPYGAYLGAIDFCAAEEGFPPLQLRSLLDEVRDFNERHPQRALAVLLHVGESFSDKSLESAVRWVDQAAELGVHRLGHAIALGVDVNAFGEHVRTETVAERQAQIDYDRRYASELATEGLSVDLAALAAEASRLDELPKDARIEHRYERGRLDEVRRRQIVAMRHVARTGAVIESCPTSNLRIGGLRDPRHHPLPRFLQAKLPVVVGADDPGLFGTSLEAEFDQANRLFHLSPEQLSQLRQVAWRSRCDVLSGRTA